MRSADYDMIVSPRMPEHLGGMAHLGGQTWALRPDAPASLATVLRHAPEHACARVDAPLKASAS